MPKLSGDHLRRAARILLALVFIGLGLAHFIVMDDFVAIMPPYLPWHVELVLLSGVFELAGGALLLTGKLKQLTRWGLVLLLIAVFPANVQHAMHPPPDADLGVMGWIRLPFQLVFIAWTLWVTRPDPPATEPTAAEPGAS